MTDKSTQERSSESNARKNLDQWTTGDELIEQHILQGEEAL